MAVGSVSLAEVFRPWRSAGVWHVLAEPAEAEAGEPAVEDRPGADAWAAESSTHERLAEPSVEATAAPDSSPRPGVAEPKRMPGHAAAPSSFVKAAVSPAQGTPAFSDPKTWPEAWQRVLPKHRNSLLLWTYPELGLDLAGQGQKERSVCLKNILGQLALPAGTSVFWPMALPEEGQSEGTLKANVDIFQAGLAYLRPKAVVLVGAESLDPAGFGGVLSGQAYSQQIAQGRMFITLPSFSSFFEFPETLERAVAYLRAVIASLRARQG